MSSPELNYLSNTDYYLYSIIPFGQTLLRSYKFNGSFDASFFLLPIFQIFPWSFFSSYYITKNGLELGNGPPPINAYLLIPIITKIILLFLVQLLKSDSLKGDILSVISNIIVLLSIFLMLYLENQNCSDSTANDVMVKTVIIHGLTGLLFFSLFSLFHYIPFVGDFVDIGLDISYNIPYLGPIIKGLVWAYVLLIVDLTMKMYNQQYNKTSCANPMPAGFFNTSIFAICGGMVVYNFYNDFIEA
jgi:hypothetical protein